MTGALLFKRQFTALLFAASLSPSVWFQGTVEIAFVVLLVIVAQLCYHLSNLRVQPNTAEKETTCSVTLDRLSLISVFSCVVEKSAQPLAQLPFFLYPDVNGIVNIAGAPGGTGAPPEV